MDHSGGWPIAGTRDQCWITRARSAAVPPQDASLELEARACDVQTPGPQSGM